MKIGINHREIIEIIPIYIILFTFGIFDNKTSDRLESQQNADKQVASKVGPTISVGEPAL